MKTNCPNCGAPITADICEYCGTVVRQNKDMNDSVHYYADSILYRDHEKNIDSALHTLRKCNTDFIDGVMTPNEFRYMYGLSGIHEAQPEQLNTCDINNQFMSETRTAGIRGALSHIKFLIESVRHL